MILPFYLKKNFHQTLSSTLHLSVFFTPFYKTYNTEDLWWSVRHFSWKSFFFGHFYFMGLPETPGFGSLLPTLWFSLPSFDTRPGLPAVRWTLHQTGGEETHVSVRAHGEHVHTDANARTHGYIELGAVGCLRRLATGHISSRHKNMVSCNSLDDFYS